jgi:hypothetical protein
MTAKPSGNRIKIAIELDGQQSERQSDRVERLRPVRIRADGEQGEAGVDRAVRRPEQPAAHEIQTEQQKREHRGRLPADARNRDVPGQKCHAAGGD